MPHQAGAQGFDITVTRVFKDLGSGAEIKRETFKTHYAAEPIIRCVAAPADPAPDGTTRPGRRGPVDASLGPARRPPPRVPTA